MSTCLVLSIPRPLSVTMKKAVVGSINMDFRSQYLNFECAVYIYKNPVVGGISGQISTKH